MIGRDRLGERSKKGSFGIGTFSRPGTKAFPAPIQADGVVLELTAQFYDTHAIFDDWERNFDTLVDLAANPHAPQYRLESCGRCHHWRTRT